MIVLGLDPGTLHFGWGVVEKEGTRLRHRGHGTVHTDPESTIAQRLVAIESALVIVIERFAPTHASIESLFYAKDAQAAAKLGHARGVGLLVCARRDLPIAEYAPALVKRAVVGRGRAEKTQVAQMVRVVLGLADVPQADAADALAIAMTHLQHAPLLAAKTAARAALTTRKNTTLSRLIRQKMARG